MNMTGLNSPYHSGEKHTSLSSDLEMKLPLPEGMQLKKSNVTAIIFGYIVTSKNMHIFITFVDVTFVVLALALTLARVVLTPLVVAVCEG